MPLRAQIRRGHRQRSRQVALDERLPVLRRADAQVRIDRERVGGGRSGRREPVGQRQRVLEAVADRERRGERRLLSQEQGDGIVEGRVAVDPVPSADHQRRSGNGPPRDPDTRLKPAAISVDQAGRVLLARQRACPARDDGADRRKVRRHVQVHETSVKFRGRRLVFPARTRLHGERRAEAHVVGDVGVGRKGAQILVGVSEGNRAGTGNAEHEVGEVGTGQLAGEGEAAARDSAASGRPRGCAARRRRT